MIFRHFQNSDFEQVVKLFKCAFDIKEIKIEECREKLTRLLKSKQYFVYVVEDNNVILSSCVVYIHCDPFDKNFATLWYFATSEKYRKKGVGSKLLEFVACDLRSFNLESIRLTTSLNNFACQRASEKAGYKKKYCYEYLY